MKLNKLFFIFLLVAISVQAEANITLPGVVEAFYPSILKNNDVLRESTAKMLLNSSDYGQKDGSTEEYWTVYSDRKDNVTYTEPSKFSSKATTLAFGEKVRIAKIESGFALVYVENKEGVVYPRISETAESKGWIPMDHLLLWNTCLSNEQRILNKALIAYNLDEAGKMKKDLGYAFFDPDKTSTSSENSEGFKRLKTGMTFYFIMKRASNGMVLLATQSNMGTYSNNVLLGWVNSNTYVPWSQRSCLEPNWNPDVVATLKGKQLNIYSSEAMSGHSTPFTIGKPFMKDKAGEEEQYRLPPSTLRFPILEANGEKYKCTHFATAGGDITDVITDTEKSFNKRKEALENMSHVNLIIVIDATRSMKPYYDAVQKAIVSGMEHFGTNVKPRVGVVLYRDYQDGEYVTEVCPLGRADSPQLLDFLKTTGKHGCGEITVGDPDQEEALYKGIEKALDRKTLGYSPEESNLMLVVGDCGNHENDSNAPSLEELVNGLVKNKVNLMAFQVMRTEDTPWLLFANQMEDMLIDNINQQYRTALGSSEKARFSEVINANSYDLRFNDNVNRQFFVASFRSPMSGAMSTSDLTKLMSDNLGNFSKAVQDRQDALVNPNGFETNDDLISVDDETAKADSAWLVSLVGLNDYKMIKRTRSLLAYTGYTNKKIGNQEAWKPVVFISSPELTILLERLKDVSTQTTDRKTYYNAICALIKTMIPDENPANMPIDQVTDVIGGLVATSNAMSSHKLVEILDSDAISEAEFRRMTKNFSDKTKILDNISQDGNYPFIYDFNGAKYYWIPVELLP